MKKYNYHTHTFRCGHAEGTAREYVEAAIRGGYQILGFSDHVPYPFLDGHVSHMRMTLAQTRGYFDELLQLKEAYKNQIEIHIGFEAEYDMRTFPRLKAFLDDYPCEYLIQGQHFLDVEHEQIYSGMRMTDPDILRAYADRLIACMESGYFLYVAHPDLPDFRGSDEVYDNIMRPVCQAAKALDMPLEINLLGLVQGRVYPTERFFKMAAEEGCRAVIGVDAHAPEMLNNEALFQKGIQFARACGVRLMGTLSIPKRA
ncbi:MAG: histidinol-phosphatase [Clostridiales bacterium]|nr:histidinol-phosphatase [Clostridiales bacterium]